MPGAVSVGNLFRQRAARDAALASVRDPVERRNYAKLIDCADKTTRMVVNAVADQTSAA